MNNSDNFTCVRTFIHRYEADFAQSRLESHGVPSMVAGDDQGGTSPHLLTGSGGARLIVRREDADSALHLLDDDPISDAELEKYAADPAYLEGRE